MEPRKTPSAGSDPARDDLDRRRQEYAAALDRELDRIVGELARDPDVEKVILFGSYAAGRRDLFADLDLVVVMRTRLGFPQRSARLHERLAPTVDVDLLVYTPEEWEAHGDRGFLRRARATGRVVHEK